ncbi:MAG: XRE family transcriptional regulator [Gammaproteobacteria bacterium]|nr:XRE family transcriptional regulator [Gammaproteobacteria bacterium]
MRMKRSSGNIFADTGFATQQAANLHVRGMLMMEIERFVKQHNMKQTKAAKYFGVNQPEISNLLKGHIDKFSIDKLVNMASRIGKEINISIKPRQTQSAAKTRSTSLVYVAPRR